MPFDFEARAQRQMQSQQHLRVGIVGFGKFGQFLARRLIAAGHQVGSFGTPVKPLNHRGLTAPRCTLVDPLAAQTIWAS